MFNFNNTRANTKKDEFEELKEKWEKVLEERKFEKLKEKWEKVLEEKQLERLKEKSRRIPGEKEKKIIKIKTPVDNLLEIIMKYEEITSKDLHKILDIPISIIESWLVMLEKKEIVKLDYSLSTIKVKFNGKLEN